MMQRKKTTFTKAFLLGLIFLKSVTGFAQKPSFNANTQVAPYTGDFAYGTNPGYYGGYNNNNTSDKLMGDLFAKGSFHTTRPALYDYFLEQYGPNIRVPEFTYFTETLGMKEMTLFVSGPSEEHRDTSTIVCNGVRKRSKMFKNLYTPIWITGADGKQKVNPQNYYAAYVYKLVTIYGKYVKFYEVWNEPDFTTGPNPYKAAGTPGSWYDSPNPCELDNMYSSLASYVRTLRITYEVVKSVDPNAYITTGGIGYESFLDVMMRSTDNPNGGKVSAEYPLQAGAYFDVLSYHMYPQYNLNKWDNKLGGFTYSRHSDKAAQFVFDFKDKLNNILKKYGYGVSYPAKDYILTEVNIPRKMYATKDFIGSEDAQRNFIIKSFVLAQKHSVRQMYTYCLGDKTTPENSQASTDGMDLMGMYLDLNKATPATAKLSAGGIGSKNISDFLYTYKYDVAKTAALALPANIEGGAFTKGSETRYVLWAKTNTDLSEIASANYTFPASFGAKTIAAKQSNALNTSFTTINGSTVALTGSPLFITLNGAPTTTALTVSAGEDKTITLPTSTATLQGIASGSDIASYTWTKTQGPAGVTLINNNSGTLNLANLTVGTYAFTLTVKDNKGNIASDQVQLIVASAIQKENELIDGRILFKVIYPQSTGTNIYKDKATNTFYQSKIRVQVETTNPDNVKAVDFTLNGQKVTDTWGDISGQVPTTYAFHNTYYSLQPGTYNVDIVVTDKNGTKTPSKATFTVSNHAPTQAREEEIISDETALSESGPYYVYSLEGVLLANGNGRFDKHTLNLAYGVYVLKTSEKTVKFLAD